VAPSGDVNNVPLAGGFWHRTLNMGVHAGGVVPAIRNWAPDQAMAFKGVIAAFEEGGLTVQVVPFKDVRWVPLGPTARNRVPDPATANRAVPVPEV
jgi:hypothetical protein